MIGTAGASPPPAPVTRLAALPPMPAGAVEQPYECFISREEVARRLSVHPRTVDRWMHRRLVPFYRIAHSVLFKWGEVEAFLARHFRVGPGEAVGQRTGVSNQ